MMNLLKSRLNPAHMLALITMVVGLAVTNGLITNHDGKLITGAASSLVSLGFLIYGAVENHGKSKIAVAQITTDKSGA